MSSQLAGPVDQEAGDSFFSYSSAFNRTDLGTSPIKLILKVKKKCCALFGSSGKQDLETSIYLEHFLTTNSICILNLPTFWVTVFFIED
jgi:hypothetical protein